MRTFVILYAVQIFFGFLLYFSVSLISNEIMKLMFKLKIVKKKTIEKQKDLFRQLKLSLRPHLSTWENCIAKIPFFVLASYIVRMILESAFSYFGNFEILKSFFGKLQHVYFLS